MKITLILFLCALISGQTALGKASKPMKKKVDPQILSILNWEKRGVSLESALKRTGWWAPTKKTYTPSNLTVLQNKKHTESVATVLRTRGIASTGQASVIETEGKKECLRTKTKNGGEKLHFKFDKKLEIAACWILHPVEKKTQKSGHSFMVFRSIEKGSRAFVVENSYVVMDKVAGDKGPHPTAQKIAKLIGAL